MGIFLNLLKKKSKTYKTHHIDLNNIPKHIAIIMDGNGRWAQKKKLPRTVGHKAGVETIRNVVKECNKLGVSYLTLYAFSTENWKRPKDEVSTLMNLLVVYLKNELSELDKNNVKINYIGDINALPTKCINELVKAKENTQKNTGLTLTLALNYGSRNEILRAVKNISIDYKDNKIKLSDIDEKSFNSYLYTRELPEPDLLIRTSGEERLSNFLLWQLSYAEFWFTDVLWPDFTKDDLRQAIISVQHRDRRYGGLK